VVNAIFGLIAGVFFSFGALFDLGGPAGTEAAQGLSGMALGAAAFIAVPILYGLLGLLSGLIVALIYNLAASVAGGIELDLE
jgi:hypothetical protein